MNRKISPREAQSGPEAAERERMRQMTRELHEAAQDAREAARELRAARADVDAAREQAVADAKHAVAEVINEGFGIMAAEFAKARETLTAFKAKVEAETTRAIDDIEKNHAELMGFADTEAFAQYIILHVAQSLIDNEAFARDMGRGMYEKLSADSALAAGGVSFARNGRGQVLVGTADALADYMAHGGDPGIVLDARE